MPAVVPDDEDDSDSDWFALAIQRAERAGKMKKKMLAEGIRRASFKCDKCDGKWHGRIVANGRKTSLWLHCDGPCQFRMME